MPRDTCHICWKMGNFARDGLQWRPPRGGGGKSPKGGKSKGKGKGKKGKKGVNQVDEWQEEEYSAAEWGAYEAQQSAESPGNGGEQKVEGCDATWEWAAEGDRANLLVCAVFDDGDGEGAEKTSEFADIRDGDGESCIDNLFHNCRLYHLNFSDLRPIGFWYNIIDEPNDRNTGAYIRVSGPFLLVFIDRYVGCVDMFIN